MIVSLRYCKFFWMHIILILILEIVLVAAAETDQPHLCWMMYQMADNDLEPFLRDDFEAISISPIVTNPQVTTWIYYDHRDVYGIEPLPNVVTPTGDISKVPTTKTQYLKWSHNYQAFVIEYVSTQEENGDNPTTVYNFVKTAINDCLLTTSSADNSSMEFIIVFASHAAGPLGFGGDDDTYRKQRQRMLRLKKDRQQQFLSTEMDHLQYYNNRQEQQQVQQEQSNSQRKRRSLTQTNEELVTALQNVLNDIPNGPTQFDVIGFDACLMQAVGAIDDYRHIAKYVLASEAVEPGHGWAYKELTGSTDTTGSTGGGVTALGLAQDIVNQYLIQKQGHNHHLTPKTLSLVDTAKFTIFLQSFDTLSGVLADVLWKGDDPDILAHIHRARNQAIMFTSVVDLEGTQRPSAVDVGSFLHELQSSCRPSPNNELSRSLDQVLAVYNDMFVVRGVGEGTVPATGMHITFPVRSEYLGDVEFFQDILWESNDFATMDAPQWLEFLQIYYEAKTPPLSTSESTTIKSAPVCTAGVSSSIEVPEGQLIIQPRLSGIVDGGHQLKTEIARETDWMLVEFGIDLTPLLDDDTGGSDNGGDQRRRRRRLQLQQRILSAAKSRTSSSSQSSSSFLPLETNLNNQRPRVPFQGHNARRATSSSKQKGQRKIHRHHRLIRDQQQSRRERNLQANQDYFILFGGDVAGYYNQSNYDAFWNRQFYLLEDSAGNLDVLYGFDNGNGQKEVPVIYIPPGNPITSDSVPFGLTEQEALARFVGAEYGYLSFSLDTSDSSSTEPEFTLIEQNQRQGDDDDEDDTGAATEILLYTSDGSTYSETPRTAGGQILPIVYVEGQLDGREIDILVGGFFSTVLDWDVNNEMNLLVTDASDYMELFEVDYLVVDVLAVDDDISEDDGDDDSNSDFTFFIIDRDGTVYIHDAGDSGGCAARLSGCFKGAVTLMITAMVWFLF